MAVTAECVLGLDLGTSGIKGILLRRDGTIIATATETYSFASPYSGWAEIDPLRWEEAARLVVAQLVAAATAANAPIVALAVDGQMHGAVLADAAGEAVRPAILWPDTRAAAELAAWRDADPALTETLANPLSPGLAGPMLAWIARHEPAAFARGRAFLSPKDWLRSRLVPGSFVADPADASATLLWDVTTDRWNRDLATAVGVNPSLLPEILPSAARAGTIPGPVAASWGLPAGVSVAVGSGDVAATLRGMGGVPGTLSVILGSGVQALLPRVAAVASATPTFHSFRASDESYFAMAAPMNGGIALQRVRELIGIDWADLYGAVDTPLLASDPFFLPYFAGERVPRPIASGTAGWRGMGLATSREVLAASAVEGMIFGLRRAIAELPANEGTIDLVGGGSRHPLVQQLMADALGRPVARRSIENATATGAALLAWECAGVIDVPQPFEPGPVLQPRARGALEERYARFVAATEALG